MWRLAVAKSAARSVARFPAADQRRIEAALLALVDDPFDPVHSRGLQPSRDRRRWRVGEYRIFYTLDRRARVVIVTEMVRRTTTTY